MVVLLWFRILPGARGCRHHFVSFVCGLVLGLYANEDTETAQLFKNEEQCNRYKFLGAKKRDKCNHYNFLGGR
jgi:hypothetical protein